MILAQGQYTIRRLPLGGNLLKWQEEWSLGNGIISGWSNNGNSDENSRVMGSNPFGINSMLWKCVPDATVADNGGSAGGYNTSTKVLDKNFAYRYCVFVYKNKTGGTTYHGCQGVNNLDGTANGNPYFWNGTLTPGQWYLMVGVIHPNSITAQSGISGVYDMTGKKIASGTDYKFRTDGTNASFRSYLYYSYDTTVNQWFYNPMLHKLDGTETSIEQILQVSVRGEVDAVKTDYSSRFDVLNESISAKATKTEVNDLTIRVTSAEQKLEPDRIISTVKSTINQAGIGNKNLIKNSDFSNGKTGWYCPSVNVLIDNTNTFWNNNSSFKFVCRNIAGTYDNMFQAIPASYLKPNTTYTLSCYAKWDNRIGSGLFGLFVEGNATQYNTVLPGVTSSPWTRFSITFNTTSSTDNLNVGWYFNNNYPNTANVWLAMFKLEESSVMTPWCLASEDQTTKNWVEQNYSTVSQTNDKIALEIGKVQLGGRNLITNSSNIYNISHKQLLGTFTHNVADKDGGNNATQITFDRANGFFRIGLADTTSALKISGNTYTYSIWIYPLVGSQVKMSISALDPILINLIAGKWQRISITGTMVDGAWYDAWRFVDITSINSGDSFKIYHPQVEIGNKLSDWSPNPDDTPTKDNILASINLSQEDIKIKAEKIALEGTVTANDNFKIRRDGVMEAKGAVIEGMVKALSGNIGKFSIVDGDIIGLDSSNVERVRFSSNPLPAVSSLFTGYSIISDSLDETFDDYFERDVEMGIERTSVTYSVRTNITLNAASNIRIDGQGGKMTVLGNLLPVETITKTDIIRIYNSQGVLITTGDFNYPINVNATGTVTVELESTFTIHNMSDGYRYSIVVDMGWQGIQLQSTTEKTYIGSDGYYSVFGSGEYIYFKRGTGLICKGKSDMPGVLAAGSVSSSGVQTNTWGAKVTAGSAGKAATGIFNVPHAIGNTSYAVNITCNAADCIAYVSGKSANSVQITIRRGGSNFDCGFDYTLLGTN